MVLDREPKALVNKFLSCFIKPCSVFYSKIILSVLEENTKKIFRTVERNIKQYDKVSADTQFLNLLTRQLFFPNFKAV